MFSTSCVGGDESLANKINRGIPSLGGRCFRSLDSEHRCPSGHRAPKVTVTRERVSLCQKGVTHWLLFLVNGFFASKRAKTSRGAGCELHSSRPPAVEDEALAGKERLDKSSFLAQSHPSNGDSY